LNEPELIHFLLRPIQRGTWSLKHLSPLFDFIEELADLDVEVGIFLKDELLKIIVASTAHLDELHARIVARTLFKTKHFPITFHELIIEFATVPDVHDGVPITMHHQNSALNGAHLRDVHEYVPIPRLDCLFF
jgi:hypothetical protein